MEKHITNDKRKKTNKEFDKWCENRLKENITKTSDFKVLERSREHTNEKCLRNILSGQWVIIKEDVKNIKNFLHSKDKNF